MMHFYTYYKNTGCYFFAFVLVQILAKISEFKKSLDAVLKNYISI